MLLYLSFEQRDFTRDGWEKVRTTAHWPGNSSVLGMSSSSTTLLRDWGPRIPGVVYTLFRTEEESLLSPPCAEANVPNLPCMLCVRNLFDGYTSIEALTPPAAAPNRLAKERSVELPVSISEPPALAPNIFG